MSKITKQFSSRMSNLLINDITSGSNYYYVFASRHSEWSNELLPDATTLNPETSFYHPHREMMFAKKVTNSDVKKMVRRITWAGGTKYSQYDNRDVTLMDSNFFVINNSNDVFKCLYNGSGSNSTVEPTTKQLSPFKLADGYIWKYMFSVSSANGNKFASDTLIPIDANTTVQNGATNGAIEVISIENGGIGYTGYNTGTIQQVVNTTVFKIDSSAASTNNYYSGSALYVTGGTGQGNLVNVVESVSNNTGRYVKISEPKSFNLTSQYLISPRVTITGDGTGAKAYSTVNTTTYAIESVVVVAPGSNYSQANVTVSANSSYGTGAKLSATISPPGGHGKDPFIELGGEIVAVSVDFNDSETSTIPDEVKFGVVGLMVNPKTFANPANALTSTTWKATTDITLSGATATFPVNDTITGVTSGAKGLVAFANSTLMRLTNVIGTFANGESLSSQTSAVAATVAGINNSQLYPYSGDILFINHVPSVDRTVGNKETVKVYFKL